MLSLSGHIGTKASALVDGQLGADDEERAWSHVLACPGCRRLVEREGWIKRQLGGLSATPAPAAPPARLLGSLYDVDAWAEVDEIEKRSLRRRTTAVVVGGGVVGVCALGLIAVTGAPTGSSDVPLRPSPSMVSQELPGITPSARPTRAETGAPTPWGRRSR